MLGTLAASLAIAQSQPGAAPPPAAAETGLEAWQAPTLTITRYDEHYEALADPSLRAAHWSGRFKYIPLDQDAYLTTGLELRARNETYRNNLWGDTGTPNDSYLWLRAMPYADLHVGSGAIGARGFVQPILAYAVGVSPSAGPIDQTRADLLQGFADFRVGAETGATDAPGATLRAGRQMLSLGTERLVGTRYGPNVPLAFDGVRALVSMKGALLSVIAVRPVKPASGDFDDRIAHDKALWGGYATLPGIGAASSVDLYWLGYRNRAARFGNQTAHELRQSAGARFFGAEAGWHWNVEGVYQFGRFGGGPISAWTLGTEIGHAFDASPLKPDATLRLNIVSGDRRRGDHLLGTFNALFPKGKYFGELSPVGPTNIISFNPRLAMTPMPSVTTSIAAMAYWRYSLADGVYDIPGNLIRAPGTSTARFIGKELEGTVAWQATPELELAASLSAFAAGGFLRQTGPSRTIIMLGLEANFRF